MRKKKIRLELTEGMTVEIEAAAREDRMPVEEFLQTALRDGIGWRKFKKNGFAAASVSPGTDSATTSATAQVAPLALTLKQASEHSGVSRWFLRSAIWSGELPARLVGKRLMVLPEDLRDFIQGIPLVRSGK